MDLLFPIILALFGAYAIFYGVKLIATGKMGEREEARIAAFSEQGARTYKLVNAIVNILAGIVLIGWGVIRFLQAKNMIANGDMFRFIAIGILVVFAIVIVITWFRCKKMQ